MPPCSKKVDRSATSVSGPGRCYRPVYEAILAKLEAETEQRPGRTVEAWILAERECVLHEVNRQRTLLAYESIGIAVIERVERMAVGHSDYLSKYAHVATDLVFRREVS